MVRQMASRHWPGLNGTMSLYPLAWPLNPFVKHPVFDGPQQKDSASSDARPSLWPRIGHGAGTRLQMHTFQTPANDARP